MRLWRIAPASREPVRLTGEGGLYASGRWHRRGRPIVYASATPSLAALEVLVHVDPDLAPDDLRLVEIELPPRIRIERCDPATLTPDWRDYPAPPQLAAFGDAWLASGRTAILSVPSAVLPIERNYLVNPLHRDATRIGVAAEHAFSFDPRLFAR